MRRWAGLLWLPALLLAAPSWGAQEQLKLARLGVDGSATLTTLSPAATVAEGPLPAGLQTPLGSVWKLFVWAHAVERGLPDPAYQCRGGDREEVYCCERGGSIQRDEALVRSCGRYFAPERLGIEPAAWRDYWQARGAPPWLRELAAVRPETEVPVGELLSALHSLPAQAEARRLLLDVVLNAREARPVGQLGGRLRIKTWSWHRPEQPESRIGGFAGWLVDGSPVWASAPGTSLGILARYAEVLGSALPGGWPAEPGGCVEVALFSRYPVRSVVRAGDGRAAQGGRLSGRFRVVFENGNRLDIESRGELVLAHEAGAPRLIARLDREEYVARVLDREAGAEPPAASRALAIAIRSYLQQAATRAGECLAIADSSASQRVAPRPASPQARAVAAWTADLVLAGSPVSYHLEEPGPDRLSWKQAVGEARAGARFDVILAAAFPRASLTRWDRPAAACEPLDGAREWLVHQLPRWRPRLDGEPGYGETGRFAVCRLLAGKPHTDREQRRIFVRGLSSQQDRLDLAHEYLHLAFEAHPRGRDEQYVEQLARRLLLE